MWLRQIWLYLYYAWIHRMLKWFIHRATGKCELLRICASERQGAPRTLAVESSLKNSRVAAFKRIIAAEELEIKDAVNCVVILKAINPSLHPRFVPSLTVCLQQSHGYKKLTVQVHAMQKERYSSDIPEHEQDLLKLWTLLKPGVTLESRKTKQWGDLGFQGTDPATDFRGMGILGLQNLLFFAEKFNNLARKVLSNSFHPKHGYSFAVVGINLTSLLQELLVSGTLKPHFYNTVIGEPTLYHFHKIYCYVFSDFDAFWTSEEPESVMEFSRLRDKYMKNLKEKLRNKDVMLQSHFLDEKDN